MSNPRIEAWDVFASWVPEMVGPRTDIVVAMDWTDYDADGQATLALKLVTRHGRATPLICKRHLVPHVVCPAEGWVISVRTRAMSGGGDGTDIGAG